MTAVPKFSLMALLLLVMACQTTAPNVTIPNAMPTNVANSFQRYLDHNTFQKAFAITLDGRGPITGTAPKYQAARPISKEEH